MTDYRNFFCEHYIALMINYWQTILSDMPKFKVIERKVNNEIIPCIRVIHDDSTSHEYYLKTVKGQQTYQAYLYQEQLIKNIRDYRKLWICKTSKPLTVISKSVINMLMHDCSAFNDMEYYNTLTTESARNIFGMQNHTLIYNGMPMRSKLERDVAKILDLLNLDYKYEAQIELFGKSKFTDFFIAVPIINKCFPCEVAGMLDNESYYDKFQSDLSKYTASKYIIGRNLLIIGETGYSPISTTMIAALICSFINNNIEETITSNNLNHIFNL
ncbi:MAG: hypothetical protein MJ153_08575 [Clostridia bacterium]|nr:hypothetical protein [Clostridia bacterium]